MTFPLHVCRVANMAGVVHSRFELILLRGARFQASVLINFAVVAIG